MAGCPSEDAQPPERPALDSIRFEASRDGVEGFELLGLLAEKDEKKAMEICSTMVRSITDCRKDPARFRRARSRILAELS